MRKRSGRPSTLKVGGVSGSNRTRQDTSVNGWVQSNVAVPLSQYSSQKFSIVSMSVRDIHRLVTCHRSGTRVPVERTLRRPLPRGVAIEPEVPRVSGMTTS